MGIKVLASSPPDVESVTPLVRVLLAIAALAVFRWSVYGVVSTATTADIDSRERLRFLIEQKQTALRSLRYEEALVPLEELTRLQPKNHIYWWERAMALGSLRRPRDEIDALEQFVKLSTLPDEACPRLAFLYVELGLKREAMDAFERCAKFSPNDSEMAFYLGHAYEMDGQVERALAVYTEALRHNINADVEAGVGRMLLRQGKPAAAYQAVAAVLARNANNADALLVAGLALTRQGKHQEARVLLERGVAHHDGSDLRYALGVIAEIQGKPREALVHYEAAIQFNPDDKNAKARRARLAPPGK